ncbi:hypothetical protein BX666DRAFT_1919405 [Dichotomocladium elegans]|nr:hypothetical protein BX666DRAFT_1919405 [Dichotomocladium elegans]
MAQPVAKKLLVVGGSGFVGRNVCKHAVRHGWETVSLSRHGEPDKFKASPRPDWADKVHWATGDSLKPETYKHLLENVSAIVHSVGIISELDYKPLANAKTLCDIASNVSRLAGELAGAQDRGNPLQKTPSPTFEMMNRDTAIALAKEAANVPSVDAFVYMSAADVLPFVDRRYFSSKRQAEQYLFSRPEFRTVCFRPGLMYSEERPATLPFAAGIQLANMVTKPVAKELSSLPFGSALTTPALNIDTVASAIIAAISRPGLKGIFDVEGIQELAHEKV